MNNEKPYNDYKRDGIVFPIDVLDADEALALVPRFEELKTRMHDWATTKQIMKANIVSTWVDTLIRNESLLDAVRAIIGPNVLCWSATFFAKEPNSAGYVGWHQDINYWGLAPHGHVLTAWLALTDAKIDNGCMRVATGTHDGPLYTHEVRPETSNMLNAQQEVDVENIDNEKIVDVELAPGQASLHHCRLLHCSNPNTSPRHRIGLSINYISTDVVQSMNGGKDSATLVSGADAYGNFVAERTPTTDFAADERSAWLDAMRYPSGLGSTTSADLQRLNPQSVR